VQHTIPDPAQMNQTRCQFDSIEKDRERVGRRMNATTTDFGGMRGTGITSRRQTSVPAASKGNFDLNRTWTAE